MSDVVSNDPQEASGEGLQPLYKSYARQKCFIGYSERAPWSEDLLSACKQVFQEPEFNLEADYARKHLYPDTPLREKALELIANARYGIYDISHWRINWDSSWLMPRNVFIELGIAVALNRPVLLLRHAENAQAGLKLPKCLENLQIVEWTGDITLQATLRKVLPQWIKQDPEHAWWNHHCNIGGRLCEHRESHPRAQQWVYGALCCHIADGQDVDQIDFRTGVETELGHFDVVEFEHLDDLQEVEGYNFLLCSHCQAVRSNRFAIYRITPHTAAETYLAIGMTIGLEKQFGYHIPKMVFADTAEAVPSLLGGYEVVTASNNHERTLKLAQFMPEVIKQINQALWRPSQLPFIPTRKDTEEDMMPARETVKFPPEAVEPPTEPLVTASEAGRDQTQSQDTAAQTCPTCATTNRAEAKFCANCGAELGASSTKSGLLVPGTILHQRYQVTGLTYLDDMSFVYQVKDLSDTPPSTWVMKEIRSDINGDLFRSFSHRNIPRIRDRLEEGERAYLVMEYTPGETLDKVLVQHNGPIEEKEVLAWAVEICDALDYLHTRNPPVIHRDVQPGNIMIANDGTVRLIDFTIARTYKLGKARDTIPMGTAEYAPLEQFGTAQTDGRTDIYALGATMYNLLTNKHTDFVRLPGDPEPVSAINPKVSRQTSDIIKRAMQKDRSQRYQSAAEMRQAIATVGQPPVIPGQPSPDTTASSVTCTRCGTVSQPNARFCPVCGAPLAALGATRAMRGTRRWPWQRSTKSTS